jgi:hypothetical protein
MENPLDLITKTFSGTFAKHMRAVEKMCTRFDKFMIRVKNGKIPFFAGGRFSLGVSVLMSLLASIVYLNTSSDLNAYLFCAMIIFTWAIILVCGIAFWIPAKLYGGKSNMIKTVTGFSYLSLIFVFIRIVELPMMMVTHKAILTQSEPLQNDISGLISLGIYQSFAASISNALVALGYLVLGYLTYRMLRVVHELDRLRALISTCTGILIISMVAVYVQAPVVELFVFANKV